MSERKTATLRVRLTPAERDRLQAVADAHGVSASRWVRRVVRESTGCGPDFFGAELSDVRRATDQVSAIGRNLNQIARKVNSGDYSPPLTDAYLAEVAREVEGVARSVARVMRNALTRWTP